MNSKIKGQSQADLFSQTNQTHSAFSLSLSLDLSVPLLLAFKTNIQVCLLPSIPAKILGGEHPCTGVDSPIPITQLLSQPLIDFLELQLGALARQQPLVVLGIC
ncbi:hypothetical protein NE237_003498 [Protea cynaroides]|uniref:Uncharacterized protein n=1 Tax=Protea cynaroides TaxID=273540 RepID=A0A9Q0KH58_9MAGN|nr:hypothetical protein NE237_003498 [Protea cynaroides]